MNGNDAPLILHVIYRLSTGGLENGLINIINRLPVSEYRHAIICIEDYSDFRNRISRPDVEVIAIRKKPGRDFGAWWRLLTEIRRLRPTIVHTRNIAALDAVLPACIAGVKCRIHGEHGWDVGDLGSGNARYRWLRKMYAPLINEFVALSSEIEKYFTHSVGVDPAKIHRIPNGVDSDKFQPAVDKAAIRKKVIPGFAEDSIVIGAVGRIEAVKDQMNLADAFVSLLNSSTKNIDRVRLAIVGDGTLRDAIIQRLQDAGLVEKCWIPGDRDNISGILQSLDIFVQPSLAEGISNTILEAMACGLPVIATDVGGNPELVEAGLSGTLVPAGNSGALAKSIASYLEDESLGKEHGARGRQRILQEFALPRMISGYRALYDKVLKNP